MDFHASVGLFIDNACDHCCAGTRAGSFRFADPPFPDSQLDGVAINDAHKDDVRTIRKLFMGLNSAAGFAPVKGFEIIDENTAVRVSHFQGGDGEPLAIYATGRDHAQYLWCGV